MTMTTDVVMMVDDVAAVLKVTTHVVYKNVALGRLRARRLGKRLVFLPADVEAFVANLPRRRVRSEREEGR
jgi:excisionase family DNA binding protein